MKNQRNREMTWKEQLQHWKDGRQEIVDLAKEGWTNSQIARRLGLSRERVRQILKKEGVNPERA